MFVVVLVLVLVFFVMSVLLEMAVFSILLVACFNAGSGGSYAFGEAGVGDGLLKLGVLAVVVLLGVLDIGYAVGSVGGSCGRLGDGGAPGGVGGCGRCRCGAAVGGCVG